MSKLKAHANKAKHNNFIMKTGYTTIGANKPASSNNVKTMVLPMCICFGYFSLPNKPAGRTHKTTAMMMNTTVLEASG